MSPINEVLAITKDLAVIVGAAIAGYVAMRGLGTWQRQLKGGAEYEHARRVLRASYSLRESIRMTRRAHPFGRHPRSTTELKEPSVDRLRFIFEAVSKEYSSLLERMFHSADLFNAEMLEAEVLWGSKFSELKHPLIRAVHRLDKRIELHLMSLDPAEYELDRESIRQALNSTEEFLFDLSLVERDDPFWEDITKCIGQIEQALHPYLRR